MLNPFDLTWNDFCYNDSTGSSCWNTAAVITLVIVILICIIAKVIVRLTGLSWRWWLYTVPEEMPTGVPVSRVILLLVAIFLIFLIGGMLQPARNHP